MVASKAREKKTAFENFSLGPKNKNKRNGKMRSHMNFEKFDAFPSSLSIFSRKLQGSVVDSNVMTESPCVRKANLCKLKQKLSVLTS